MWPRNSNTTVDGNVFNSGSTHEYISNFKESVQTRPRSSVDVQILGNGNNVSTHLSSGGHDMVDITRVSVTRIFDRFRNMGSNTLRSHSMSQAAADNLVNDGSIQENIPISEETVRKRKPLSVDVRILRDGGNVSTRMSTGCHDVVPTTMVPISRIFDHFRNMCLNNIGSEYMSHADSLGHTVSSSRTATVNHAYLFTYRESIQTLLIAESYTVKVTVTRSVVTAVVYFGTMNDYGGRAEYHLCCGGAKIYMPPMPDPPVFIQQLLRNSHFMDHVRAYNQMFSMTSFGAKIDDSINRGRGPYVFKVSGQIYHWIGSLCPEEGHHPRFLQLYIYDTQDEVANRMQNFHEHNGLVRLFRTSRDKCSVGEIPGFKIRLYNKSGVRVYELPTSDILGGIVFEDEPNSRTDFDVITEFRGGPPQRINKLHQSYMSLQFPLLFIFGEPGFYPDLVLKPRDGRGKGKKVTMNAYYKYQLHLRVKEFRLIFRGGHLFQQYVVAVFCTVEQNQLDWVRNHQNDLRSDYLLGLYDVVSRGDREGIQTGSKIMLLRTFTGGPRYMYSHYLDALAIFLYTVEFQKRGLPHCLTLIWVDSSSKIRNAVEIDEYISAEIPDPVEDPKGYKVVTELMMHGPCGVANSSTSCTENGVCNKYFPKKYNDTTFFDVNGHTHYRRRQTEVHFMKGESRLDNCNVVPYNRMLCLAFHAHINVEYCGWSMLIKYLFKYISKGPDRIIAKVNRSIGDTSTSMGEKDIQVDEIQNYVDGRFVCPFKACWRISEFPIHYREPAVQILNVYLENAQRVTFRERDRLDIIVNMPEKKKTTLTEWYVYNNENTNDRHLTYLDFPSEFVWYPNSKSWRRRVMRTKKSLGRLTYGHLNSGELFYFRMLLSHQKGCKSPTEVRTVNGYVFPTYRATCESLGLLGDDKEWDITLDESIVSASSAEVRTLFAQIIIYCDVSDPLKLWTKYWTAMKDDIPAKVSEATGILNYYVNTPELQGYILYELEAILNGFGKSVKDFGLPPPPESLLMEERNYKRDLLIRCFEALDRTLRDLMNALEIVFGGKTVVLGRDFRQTLPVKKGVVKEELIHVSIAESYLWLHFKICKLKEKMRLLRTGLSNEERERFNFFAKWLLDVGNGEIGMPDENNDEDTSWITIPQQYCLTPGEQGLSELIDFIYDDATLKAPTTIKSAAKTYLSRDEAIPMGGETSETELLYPIEYLNTLTFPGFPPHELQLKVGSPIMLLRNNNAIQANMDLKNLDYFDSMLKPRTAYRISNFICEKTKPYQQTLDNEISLKFGKITTFEVLTGKEFEFPEHHFKFTAYNQLQSKIPYRDEDTKLIYPTLTDYLGCIRSISDVIPSGDANIGQKYRRKVDIESLDGNVVELTMWDDLAKQFKKDKIEQLPRPIIIAVSSCRVSKYRDVQGIQFTCEALITNLKKNRSWNYASCSQCNKASTKISGVYVCEDHEKQDPPTYRYNFKATVTDATATAEFTFFTEVSEKITGHPCSHLMEKFETIDKTQLLVEMVNIIGKKHIFQIQFAPSTEKGAGRFIINDVLDIKSRVEKTNIGLMINESTSKDKDVDI
ncbi:DNA helicase [Tanacetum coccineum]